MIISKLLWPLNWESRIRMVTFLLGNGIPYEAVLDLQFSPGMLRDGSAHRHWVSLLKDCKCKPYNFYYTDIIDGTVRRLNGAVLSSPDAAVLEKQLFFEVMRGESTRELILNSRHLTPLAKNAKDKPGEEACV